MSAQLARPRISVDEFLAWTAPDDLTYELEAGIVVAMAPATVRHANVKMAVFLALRDAVRRAGLDCSVYSDGLAVRIDNETSYVPDAVVQCGPPPPDDESEVDRPAIVVEVLSLTTAYRDLGVKLAGYFQVPSLQHYLIIDPERRRVIWHARANDGSIATRLPVETTGTLQLDPPGLSVPLSDLFDLLSASGS